jgi:ATP-dependent helicase/nuclease subunit A
MSRSVTPNLEQTQAIEHFGGVLLSAGAGAGKTFVLREHFIYLLKSYIEKTSGETIENRERKIKDYLKELVFMTYTKKAAGELHVRIRDRVNEEANNDPNFKIVKDNLNSFFVGTIHGFCHKLISEGGVQIGSITLELADQEQVEQKITQLLNCALDDLNEKNEDRYLPRATIVKNSQNLVDTFIKIFSSAEIKLAWLEQVKNEENTEIDLMELLAAFGLLQALVPPTNSSIIDEFKEQAFSKYLNEWIHLCRKNNGKLTYENLSEFEIFLSKTISTPRKDDAKELFGSYFKLIKDFKEFIKTHSESILAYKLHRKKEVQVWKNTLNYIFEFINGRYYKTAGISFADLEYITLFALRNGAYKKNIVNKYKYFVIDEFQDTSSVQMEIVSRIVNNDYNKLFCVGDPKQAIYGFRGGSLGVFSECGKKVTSQLNLSNNYRSLKEIIDFNNDIFSFIFALGPNFEGNDLHTIPYSKQIIPDSVATEVGKIIQYNITTSDEHEDSQELEATAIANIIRNKLEQTKYTEKVCVLYRRLAPSRKLIEKLVASNIGFTAQTKIGFGDDPILALFSIGVQLLNDIQAAQKNGRDNTSCFDYPALISCSYLKILGINKGPDELILLWREFSAQIEIVGLYYSFQFLLRALGMHNSRHEENTKSINEIIFNSSGNIQKCLKILEGKKGDSVKVEIRFGQNIDNVQIMTVHASKGLQFEHIILGGLFASKQNPPNKSKIGLIPSSFKWSLSVDQKKDYKTPDMILENEIDDQKEFSESKRLFYVAFSRAIKSISFTELTFQGEPFKVAKSSWLAGIRKWRSTNSNNHIVDSELNIFPDSKETNNQKIDIPLVYRTNLGIELTNNIEINRLAVLPELSVTKLSTILNCSRKFYLENVLKINIDEERKFPSDIENKNDFEPNEIRAISSQQRGSEIHKAIEYMLTHNQVVPLWANDNKKVFQILNWVKSITEGKILTHLFHSEKDLRFDFFGTMITGIPDLILQPKTANSAWEIWDFKTGRVTEEKNELYWMQLKAYVLGIKNVFNINSSSRVVVKLVYVDEQKIIEKNELIEVVLAQLFSQLLGALDYSKTNLDHCKYCPFVQLCH